MYNLYADCAGGVPYSTRWEYVHVEWWNISSLTEIFSRVTEHDGDTTKHIVIIGGFLNVSLSIGG